VEQDIVILLSILGVTVLLLVLEAVRIDLVAMLCMLALAWTRMLTPEEAISGFSSNAVIAIIAVMIMGEGAARTGLMARLARLIIGLAGSTRRRLMAVSSLAVGLLSGFVQNVGAAALFLPALVNISRRERIAASDLVMPVGYSALLGGLLTMVGCTSLIIVNDLLPDTGLEPFGLFAVTPVGLILLLSGVAYFYLFRRWVLPRSAADAASSPQDRLVENWRLDSDIYHYAVLEDSSLAGLTPEDAGLWQEYGLNVLALSQNDSIDYAPWRETVFEAGQDLALIGDEEAVERFADDYGLTSISSLDEFRRLQDPGVAGFAEVMVPPRSALVGKKLREFGFRRHWEVEPLVYFSDGEEIRDDFSDREIRAGDLFVIHGLWDYVYAMRESDDLVVMTRLDAKQRRPGKARLAALCFVGAILLSLTAVPISLAFLTGAMAMVLTGVLDMKQAYRAVEWKVVFLIAGLIPLGLAMEQTGAAVFIADIVMSVAEGQHPLVFIAGIAVLATFFTLVMSNVAAVIVLAPLVINMAEIASLDPRLLVLLMAICTENSFVLPTHQVNALLMTAGDYSSKDYVRAGSGMTVLFLLIVTLVFYLGYF
jgi:di/tricarboxylate transporter